MAAFLAGQSLVIKAPRAVAERRSLNVQASTSGPKKVRIAAAA